MSFLMAKTALLALKDPKLLKFSKSLHCLQKMTKHHLTEMQFDIRNDLADYISLIKGSHQKVSFSCSFHREV